MTRTNITTAAALALLLLLVALSACGGKKTPVPVGPTADELAAEGKTALLAGDGDTARTKFEAALDEESDHADANFGLGLVELLDVANDAAKGMAATNEAPFKQVTRLPFAPLPDVRVGSQPLTAALKSGSLIETDFSEIEVGILSGAQIRTLVANAASGLDVAIGHISAGLAAGGTSFSFVLPRDWNDGTAGTVTLSRADLLTLLGGLEIISANLHFGAAYSLDGLTFDGGWSGFSATSDPVDSDSSGYFEFDELATAEGIPATVGMRAADGAAHLSSFTAKMASGANHLVEAGDIYAAGNELLDHWAFNLDQGDMDAFKADWAADYRGYLSDAAASFGGTAKSRSINGEAFSINLGAFFNGLPADLRDFPLRMEDDGFGGTQVPAAVTDALTDTTLLGLIPGGLSQEQFEALGFGF